MSNTMVFDWIIFIGRDVKSKDVIVIIHSSSDLMCFIFIERTPKLSNNDGYTRHLINICNTETVLTSVTTSSNK